MADSDETYYRLINGKYWPAQSVEDAERWAEKYCKENDVSDFGPGIEQQLVIAYMAGKGQWI